MVLDPPTPNDPGFRRAVLRWRLVSRPEDGWSWLWRIHLRVADFLTRREPGDPAGPPPSRGAAFLDELKEPYIRTRQPTREELRVRAAGRQKARRVMKGLAWVGPAVRSAALEAAAHDRGARDRHDRIVRLLWCAGAGAVAVIGVLLAGALGALVQLGLLDMAGLLRDAGGRTGLPRDAVAVGVPVMLIGAIAAIVACGLMIRRERARAKR